MTGTSGPKDEPDLQRALPGSTKGRAFGRHRRPRAFKATSAAAGAGAPGGTRAADGSALGRMGPILAATAIAVIVLLGVVLRLADVNSTTVIPAEDPYTHMGLVREHLADGELTSLNEGGTLYPPGLHGFLAATWVFTGMDLYDLIRFGPVLFGAIGIVGIAILLWRSDGPGAAIVGALAIAVVPEAIMRTTMMAPTALDLAILPYFLYALVRLVRGELLWAAVAGPLGLYTVYAHPWLLAILAGAGMLYAVLSLLFVEPRTRQRNANLRGMALAVAIIGGSLGVAALEPRFFDVFLPAGMANTALTPILLVGTLAVAAALWFAPRAWDPALAATAKPFPVLVRAAMSLVLLVALVLVSRPAFAQGMPPEVDLLLMFGEPVLYLAAAGFVLLPFIASPAGNLGAAIAALTYPFVIYNPFASPFWSHRTAVFLGVGLVLLVGAAAGLALRAVMALATWRPTGSRRAKATPTGANAPAASMGSGTAGATAPVAPVGAPATAHAPSLPGPARRAPMRALVPALLVLTLLSGVVYAGTPDAYAGGWYRLYQPCEMDGLRSVASFAEQDQQAVIITGDWQAKVVLAALAPNASRIWYKPDFFQSQDSRDTLIAQKAREGTAIVVVVDRYVKQETDGADTAFADGAPWRSLGVWCTDTGKFQPPLKAAIVNGGDA